MKSFIAALRSLVLPFGATSGRRIVLDGTAGTITIYDTGGNKLLTLDGTNGVAVFDTAGNIRSRLGLPGSFYSLLELATAQAAEVDEGFVLNQGIGVAPNLKSTLSIGASSLGQDTLRWKIISNQNAATSPLIVLDTSQLPNTVTGRPILNLVGTDFGGTPSQPRVVADDYWIGADAGASVAPTMTRSLPQGILGTIKSSTANIGPTSGTNVLTLFTGDAVSLKANRKIRLTFSWRSFSATVDTDVFVARFQEGGTVLDEIALPPIGIAASDKYGGHFSFVVDSPSAASHTYSVTLTRIVGTGTATMEAAATFPLQFYVEDVGGT